MTGELVMVNCTCKDGKRRGKTCEWCNGTGSFSVEVERPNEDGIIKLERAQTQKDLF